MSQNNVCKANSFSNLIFRLWLVICLNSGIQETVCPVPNLLYVHLLLVSCFLRNSDDYAVIIAGYDLRQLILLSSSDEESHWVPLRKPSFCAGLLSLSFCPSPWLHLWISNIINMMDEIIKVELSYQQRLVSLTETLIILGTTKPNLININCIISKRISMLKADVSVSSWHHSQGKMNK